MKDLYSNTSGMLQSCPAPPSAVEPVFPVAWHPVKPLPSFAQTMAVSGNHSLHI